MVKGFVDNTIDEALKLETRSLLIDLGFEDEHGILKAPAKKYKHLGWVFVHNGWMEIRNKRNSTVYRGQQPRGVMMTILLDYLNIE